MSRKPESESDSVFIEPCLSYSPLSANSFMPALWGYVNCGSLPSWFHTLLHKQKSSKFPHFLQIWLACLCLTVGHKLPAQLTAAPGFLTSGAAAWGGSCSPDFCLWGQPGAVWGHQWRTPACSAARSWSARPHYHGPAWRSCVGTPACGWRTAGKPCYWWAGQRASGLSPHVLAYSQGPAQEKREFRPFPHYPLSDLPKWVTHPLLPLCPHASSSSNSTLWHQTEVSSETGKKEKLLQTAETIKKKKKKSCI